MQSIGSATINTENIIFQTVSSSTSRYHCAFIYQSIVWYAAYGTGSSEGLQENGMEVDINFMKQILKLLV